MRRRSRITLIVLSVVVGIPALLAIGVVIFVSVGGVERRIEREFAERMPGRLTIGRVEVASTGRAVAHDCKLYPAGGSEWIAAVDEAVIEGGLLIGAVDRITLTNLRLRVGGDMIAWLRELGARPMTTNNSSSAVTVSATGEIAIAQRLVFRDLMCDLRLLDRALEGTMTAQLDQAPVSISFEPQHNTDGHATTTLAISGLPLNLADGFAALDGLGMLDTPEQVLPWLPPQIELAGTRLEVDPTDLHFEGTFKAVWKEGSVQAALSGTGDGISLNNLQVEDSGLGTAQGQLAVAYTDRQMHLTLQQWHPGPRLGIPAQVPMAALLDLMPEAGLDVIGGDAQQIQARFHNAANTAWIHGSWQPGEAVRIDGGGLPLAIGQRFLPEGWTVEDGVVQGLSLTWQGHLQRALLDVSDLALAVGAWRCSDLDGSLSVEARDPTDASQGLVSRLDVPFGSVIHRGILPGGECELTIVDIAGFTERIEGPQALPACTGLLKLIASMETAPDGTWQGTIRHLGFAGLGIEGIVRNVAIAAHGHYAWRDSGVEAVIDGQLFAAEMGLPGHWIDLSTRQPRFTATVLSDETGFAAQDVLARAADGDGQPIADGFTAGLQGHLDRDLNGGIEGVVDRIDLAYLSDRLGLVPLPPATALTGESAVTWKLAVAGDRVESLSGVALPLGADLSFLNGDISIEGITGAARFTLAPVPDVPEAPRVENTP